MSAAGGLGLTWLVARREVLDRVRRTSYRFVTVALFLIVVAAGAVYGLLDTDDDRRSVSVAVIGEATPALSSSLQDPEGATPDVSDPVTDVEIHEVAEQQDAVALLEGGAADVAIDPSQREILWLDEPDPDVELLVEGALRYEAIAGRAAQAGVGDQELAAILEPVEVTTTSVEESDEPDAVGALVGAGAAILLLTVIAFYGNYVMMGVVEEKTTAVVEVLLGQLRPHQLLTGKVTGMGVAALGQVAAVVAGGTIALLISGVEIPAGVAVAIPTALGWFLLGFAFYATLYAVAGSLVSRMEDAGQAAAPLTVLLMIGYFAAFQAVGDPTGAIARVASLIPPAAPLLMPVRIAAGTVPWWEVAVAAVLLLGACAAMLRLGGRIYARSILHRGSRLRWRQALRGA